MMQKLADEERDLNGNVITSIFDGEIVHIAG